MMDIFTNRIWKPATTTISYPSRSDCLQKWGQTWWGERSVNQLEMLWFLSSYSLPGPHFTWGSWVPGYGENRRVQVTLSANHIMICIIPPHTTHHTPHTVSVSPHFFSQGYFNQSRKKVSCRQQHSISESMTLWEWQGVIFNKTRTVSRLWLHCGDFQNTAEHTGATVPLCLNLVKSCSHSSVFSNRVFNEVHLFW